MSLDDIMFDGLGRSPIGAYADRIALFVKEQRSAR